MELLNKQVIAEHMLEIRKQTLKKWDELGYLEGIDLNKPNIALLYEAQASCLIKEKKDYRYLLIR